LTTLRAREKPAVTVMGRCGCVRQRRGREISRWDIRYAAAPPASAEGRARHKSREIVLLGGRKHSKIPCYLRSLRRSRSARCLRGRERAWAPRRRARMSAPDAPVLCDARDACVRDTDVKVSGRDAGGCRHSFVRRLKKSDARGSIDCTRRARILRRRDDPRDAGSGETTSARREVPPRRRHGSPRHARHRARRVARRGRREKTRSSRSRTRTVAVIARRLVAASAEGIVGVLKLEGSSGSARCVERAWFRSREKLASVAGTGGAESSGAALVVSRGIQAKGKKEKQKVAIFPANTRFFASADRARQIFDPRLFLGLATHGGGSEKPKPRYRVFRTGARRENPERIPNPRDSAFPQTHRAWARRASAAGGSPGDDPESADFHVSKIRIVQNDTSPAPRDPVARGHQRRAIDLHAQRHCFSAFLPLRAYRSPRTSPCCVRPRPSASATARKTPPRRCPLGNSSRTRTRSRSRRAIETHPCARS